MTAIKPLRHISTTPEGEREPRPCQRQPPALPADASQAVVRGASLLIIIQVASRAITFIANQLLVRYLTAQLLGISTQLEVYYLSVLFFARESLRVAVQRQETRPGSNKQDGPDSRRQAADESQAVINLGYLAILLGFFVNLGLAWIYLATVEKSTMDTPHLVLALRVYGIAAMLELLSEPCFVLMQTRLQFGTRATAESVATFLRCIVTLSVAVWGSSAGVEVGALPFATGQLTYGLSLLLVYVWGGSRLASADGFSLLPRSLARVQGSNGEDYIWSYFYRPTVSLASSMMAQSIAKNVLTRGDTYLVSILSTPRAQGVYALANNYGGLIARLVFQPVEESSRSYFSRLLSNKTTDQGKDPKGTAKAAATTASQHLHTLTKLYVLLSVVIVSIGPVAAPSLLSLVAGSRWVSEGAGEVLAVYCYYIPLLAINGVAEAFVASVATESEVHGQSAWMLGFSVAFGAAGFVFMRVMDLGAKGLVFANCINMICRIVWSLTFIKSYFNGMGAPFDLLSLRPEALTTVICFATPAVIRRLTKATSVTANTPFMDLLKIGTIAVPIVAVMLFAERKFLFECFNALRARRAS